MEDVPKSCLLWLQLGRVKVTFDSVELISKCDLNMGEKKWKVTYRIGVHAFSHGAKKSCPI